MAVWILVAMLAAGVFGFSVLPIMVIGAASMAGLSYLLTRDQRIARCGFGFAAVVANFVVVTALQTQPGILEVPAWASWLASDLMLEFVSAVVIVWTMFIGIYGPIIGGPGSDSTN